MEKTIRTPGHAIQLDGLRFFAVFAVIICHWMQYSFMSYIPFGSAGVNLFFVLSGYLITSILLRIKDADEIQKSKPWKSLRQFYIRRILRIFPIYFLTVGIFWLMNFDRCRELFLWLVSYSMNIYIFLPGNNYGHFGHFWSLAVEEQFYIFFPFLILFLKRKYILPAILLLIFSGLITRICLYFAGFSGNIFYSLTPCAMDAFGAGALLSYLALYHREKLLRILENRILWLCVFFVFAITTYLGRKSGAPEARTVFERFFCSMICFWIVGRASHIPFTGFFQKIIEHKVVLFTGRISYGIYLYHVFVPEIFRQVFQYFHLAFPYQEHSVLVNTPFYLAATFLLAILSWVFVEKYMMRLKTRFGY